MIQRQFEFPYEAVCHFESDSQDLIEQCPTSSVSLSTNTLHFSYGGGKQSRHIEKSLVCTTLTTMN